MTITSLPIATAARIDWRAAACLLVGGLWPGEVAEKLGIDEQRFWRHLHKSARFRHYIRQALERRRLVLQLHFAAGVPEALDLFRSASGQDLSWLAEMLGIGGEAEYLRELQRATPEQGDVADRLGATGNPPPRRSEPDMQPPRSEKLMSEKPISGKPISENEQEGREGQRPDIPATARPQSMPLQQTSSRQMPSLVGDVLAGDVNLSAAAAAASGRQPVHMLGGG